MNEPRPRIRLLLSLTVLVGGLLVGSQPTAADEDNRVTVTTPLGSFQIELFPEDAPVTVANFLDYIRRGRFDDAFFHRSIAGFVLQGGGYYFRNGASGAIPTSAPIVNEFKRSNVRGTLAMAKIEGDPNSATSQWFINLADNSGNLDSQNGGFTVFGQVVGNGMAVVDALAAVETYNLGGAFTEIPLRDFTSGAVTAANLLFTQFGSDGLPATTRPLLLRNDASGKWFSYRLGPAAGGVGIEQKGKVKLPSDQGRETVSRGDFNGDGEPDVLLRDMDSGAWTVALLTGRKVDTQSLIALPASLDLEVVATADFDGDRRGDVLLRDAVTGRWQIWLLDGVGIRSGGEVAIDSNLAVSLVDVGDLDGDGDADVLVRAANGKWTTYLVNGPGTPESLQPKLPRSKKIEPQAMADFDGDGTIDVLARASNGKWTAYLFRDGKVRSKGSVAMPKDRDLSVAAVADFNGDGTADVLLRHADGSWLLYTLDGRKVVTSGAMTMTEDTSFGLINTEDADRDGMADVLVRDADGDWMLYTIDGTVPGVASSSVPKLNRNPSWVPQLP